MLYEIRKNIPVPVIPAFGADLSPKPEVNPIFFLGSVRKADTRPDVVDAGLGYLRTNENKIFVPRAVKTAAERVPRFPNNGYLVPDAETHWCGNKVFLQEVARIAFDEHADDLLSKGLIAAAGTEGATQALAITAEMMKRRGIGADAPPRALIGKPWYPNHPYIFANYGLTVQPYDHVTEAGNFNLPSTVTAIKDAGPNTAVILQTTAHNSTGMNPRTESEWKQIAQALKTAGSVAVFDLAYPGLDQSVHEDAKPVSLFLEEGVPLIATVSFSKIGGLYEKRVGGLVTLGQTRENALQITDAFNEIAQFQVSSQSGVGEDYMAEVFNDGYLYRQWAEDELPEIAETIRTRRVLLANSLPDEFGGRVAEGVGMYTYLPPISMEGQMHLQTEHGVYLASSPAGTRVNIGGVPTQLIPKLAAGLNVGLDKFRI